LKDKTINFNLFSIDTILECFLLIGFTFHFPFLLPNAFNNSFSFQFLHNIYLNQEIFNISVSIVSSNFFLITEELFINFHL
jgi:hypothetical protein